MIKCTHAARKNKINAKILGREWGGAERMQGSLTMAGLYMSVQSETFCRIIWAHWHPLLRSLFGNATIRVAIQKSYHDYWVMVVFMYNYPQSHHLAYTSLLPKLPPPYLAGLLILLLIEAPAIF